MRRFGALVLAGVALIGAGCGATGTPAPRPVTDTVTVPDVVGLTLRDATCGLTQVRLRWRFPGQRQGTAGPISGCGSGGVHSSMDEFRVTGQVPTPGTRVRSGSVVVLRNPCTAARPCS